MSARVAAAQARRDLEFLEIAQGYSDRLESAKENLRTNRGDEAAISQHREAAQAMHEFRSWARTAGKPKPGEPGRDAVIVMGAK